jgi:hypothetical protein
MPVISNDSNVILKYFHFVLLVVFLASKWGLQLIFRLHNSDPTPQGMENRNILLWFKCVLTALHVNCMILYDSVL